MKNNAPTRYPTFHISLHWLMALLIGILFIVGLTMEDLPNIPQKFVVYQMHKSFGLLVLFLVAVRVLWVAGHAQPRLPAATPRWQVGMAHAVHAALYALMVLTPLTGWVMSDAAGYHPSFFGLALPILTSPNPQFAHTVKELHEVCANLIIVFAAAHAAAALKHHLVARNDVLTRMLPAWVKLPRPKIFGALLAATLGLGSASSAHAFGWNVDPQSSSITWQVGFNGAPLKGTFKDWHANIFFNPNVLEATQIDVRIATGSISSGDLGRDSTLQGPDWFNTKLFPEASFKSTKVLQAAPGLYQATGTLSIGGISRTVILPFKLSITGDKARAKGTLNMKRTSFQLGKGPWEKAQEVTDEVTVTITVNATKALK